MALDKEDLQKIEKIIGGVEGRLSLKIDSIEMSLRKEIAKTEDKLLAKIGASENKVIAVMNQKVSDLAEINRAVIRKTEKIDNHEKRIIRVETKLEIKAA